MPGMYQITSPLVGDFGDISFPLHQNGIDGTFINLDPARSRLLALFAAAINYELGTIWDKGIAGSASPLTGKRPVQSTFELDPVTHLTKQVKLDYPALCLHRVGEQSWSPHTMQVDKCEQEWNLHYILANLDVGDTRRFSDLLRVIPNIVLRVIKQRGHVAFEDGALQFFKNKGGLGSIEMTKVESGQARFGGQVESPVWLATTITLKTIEYSTNSETEFGPLEGIDWNIGVGDSTGIIPNMIEAYSDIAL